MTWIEFYKKFYDFNIRACYIYKNDKKLIKAGEIKLMQHRKELKDERST